MPSIVENTVHIDAPVEVVFAYVDDYSLTTEWIYGLHHMEPIGEQTRGVGATFDGIMKLGVSLTSRIQCTGWEQDRMIEMTSISGIKNTQRWTFTDMGGDRTRVDAWIKYAFPGGPAGRAMAAAVKPLIGVAMKHTSEALVRNVEAR